MSPAEIKNFTLKYRAWAPHAQHNGHSGGGGGCCCCSGINVYGCCCCCCSEVSVYGCCCCSGYWILSSHWSIWIVAINSKKISGKIWILAGNLNVGGKLECWREDYLGYFRFSTSGDAISGDATSGYFRWRHDPPQIRPGWCFYTTYIFNEKIKIMKNVPVQAMFRGKNQWTQQCV